MEQLVNNLISELQKLNFSTPTDLVQLFKQALANSPLILISITEFLEAIKISKFTPENYRMNTIMLYVIHNRFHNWFYIGSSFTGSIRAEKHYTEKFSPNKKSILLSEYHAGDIILLSEYHAGDIILLSEYHAGDIKEKRRNIGDEIIILPIIIFPALLELDTETENKLENLMTSIESRLVSICRNTGYNLYNDPIPLSLNVTKSTKIPFKATIENVKDYCLKRVANLKCIPYPFEGTLAEVKKRLFYNLRNQFERKVPSFFENEIYKDWFITLEFWIDLRKKYGIETVQKVIAHAQNFVKETNFSNTQKEFQSLLFEKYNFVLNDNSSIDQSSNIEAIQNRQEALATHFSVHTSQSEIQEFKNYVMDKVAKKICIPFKFEPHIGKTKTSLFYNIRNKYYRKASNFFDNIIYQNWFCTPQFWIDFENAYDSKTVEIINLHGDKYVKENSLFSEQEKKIWENAVLAKVKTSNFYPIDCTNGHITHKFGSMLTKVSLEKREAIQLFIQNWVKMDDFWNRLEITKEEYLESKIYKSLIDNTVILAQTVLIEQIHKNNVSLNKNGKNSHLFKYYTRANKQYYFYYPTVKSTILKWLDSKEFLDNFH